MTKEMTINDLAEMVKQGFDSVDKRFDTVDQRFDSMDNRIASVENSLEDIKLRLNEVAFQFQVNDHEKRIKNLELPRQMNSQAQ
jgi:archaellum component FlaC